MLDAGAYCYLCGGAHELAACRTLELEALEDDPAIETLEHGQTALAVDGDQRTLPGLGISSTPATFSCSSCGRRHGEPGCDR